MHRLGAKVLASELLLSVVIAVLKRKRRHADRDDRNGGFLTVIYNSFSPQLKFRYLMLFTAE